MRLQRGRFHRDVTLRREHLTLASHVQGNLEERPAPMISQTGEGIVRTHTKTNEVAQLAYTDLQSH